MGEENRNAEGVETNANKVSSSIEEENKKKIEACTAEINAVLAKYECDLDPSVFLRAGQVIPNVRVVILDKSKMQQPT